MVTASPWPFAAATSADEIRGSAKSHHQGNARGDHQKGTPRDLPGGEKRFRIDGSHPPVDSPAARGPMRGPEKSPILTEDVRA